MQSRRVREIADTGTAYTVAQYMALSRALAAGVLRVTVEGRTTEYQSAEAMTKTLAMMKAELQAAGLWPASTTPARTRVHVIGHKGLW